MHPQAIAKTLERFMASKYVTHKAVMIWGPPGIGKTEVCLNTFKRMGMAPVSGAPILIQYMDPTDMMGIPFLKNNSAEWSRPRIFNSGEEGKKRFWFFDDITQGYPATQNAVSQIVNNFICGVHPICSDDRFFVMTGNDVHHRAHAREMPSHLANRVLHLEMDVHPDEWREWAIKKGLPTEVTAFIQWKGNLLYKDWSEKMSSKTNPTPRTWEYAAQTYQEFKDTNEDGSWVQEVLGGYLTEGVAAEFMGFVKIYRRLPDVEKILKEGKMITDDNPGVQWAICGRLIEEFRKNPSTAGRIVEYINALKHDSPKPKPDFAVVLLRDLLHTDDNTGLLRKHAGPKLAEVIKDSMNMVVNS